MDLRFDNSSRVNIVRNKEYLKISNNNESLEKIFLCGVISTDNGKLLIDSNIKTDDDIKIIICDEKHNELELLDINTVALYNKLPDKVYIGLLIGANANCIIENFVYKTKNIDLNVLEYLKGDNISILDKLSLLEFDGDICVVNSDYIDKTIVYKNNNIVCIGYAILRNILLQKKYKKIVVDCLNMSYLKVLDAIDRRDTELVLYVDEKKVDFDMINCLHDVCNIIYKNDSKNDELDNIEKYDSDIIIPSLKKEPLLTISIASYNVSSYIIQALISLLKSKYASYLEVLVINDGSKDNTVNVVNDFVSKYYKENTIPNIKVIDKENGGHGSTINKGIELATGKYFRLLDGDDYFITKNFDLYMEKLLKEDSDLILTDCIEDYADTGVVSKKELYGNFKPYVKYDLNKLDGENDFKDWGPLLSTTTIKTELLKKAPFKIDENCYYVDMEYNLLNHLLANTFIYYPLNIYNYYLGRSGQSVALDSYIKNIKQHEKVCLSVVDNYYKYYDNLSLAKKNYIENKIVLLLCRTQYELTMFNFKTGKNFNSFNKKLKKYKKIYEDKRIAGTQVRFHRLTKGLFIFFNPMIQKIRKIIKK